MGMQSRVNGDYKRRDNMHLWGMPVLRVRLEDMRLFSLTDCGLFVRKSRVQVLIPSCLSFRKTLDLFDYIKC